MRDKLAVVSRQTKELTHFGSVSWSGQVANGGQLVGQGADPVRGQNVTQVLQFFLEEVTLDFLQVQIGLSEAFEHLAQVIQMGIYIFGVNQDVIEIRESEIQPLKDTKDQHWSLGQAEGAFVEFELAQGCGKRGLLLGFGRETHVVVTHGDV